MPGRVEGKVAFITGAARGQGRAHALKLAEEGADIIAVDICKQVDSVPYALATSEELAETVKAVEALDRRIIAREGDIRDFGAIKQIVDEGVAELGRLDIVAANAGIVEYGKVDEIEESAWKDVIDINLTGTWNTARAAIPHLRAAGGGSVILTSSAAGLKGLQNLAHYTASKHGVVGLMRVLALELAPDMIRVNSLHPNSVNTMQTMNPYTFGLFAPDLDPEQWTVENLKPRFQTLNTLPIPWQEPEDMANALLWLASEESRFVTGVTLPVDAGMMLK
ncbi:Putative short-chain type dehydrogenase/reductase (plasmid) [Rhodococcus ruber]|uniref:mycofactocin-coupled SDR family oxidoreductase n=1 Tax=Rhodococcus ruber TaxID=1830 RepID=UPI00315DA870